MDERERSFSMENELEVLTTGAEPTDLAPQAPLKLAT
jgi:hypothetical protein